MARDAANASTKAKAAFLANVSHEIRTPMHGILGMTELALKTDLSSEQRQFIGLAHSSAEGLLSLINDILDFSKIEAQKLSLESISFDLRQSFPDILRPHIIRAQQRNIELAVAIAPEVPKALVGDPLRLRQFFFNLVSNALKFTEHGSIEIQVEVLADEPHRCHLQCSVSDIGVGIPEDMLKLVFEAFTQADNSTRRKFGGTGLGLSICAQIVHLMGGRIWVEIAPKMGSTLFFHGLA